ncbi:FG-GAP-like repeat-containing protein [Mucilaginibacter litoreus]|uniref:FG-GAP-like repeat-containing protein n=1 Tax=Mucilaginibacter litoreus TaxID=1048221 RepID=A0ABW3AUI7_9SPHI
MNKNHRILLIYLLVTLSLNLYGQVPTVTSLSTYTGQVGTALTITGTNFNTTATNNVVFFGPVKATVSAATATSLSVTVPAGATYTLVSVTNTELKRTAFSPLPFRQTFPTKNSIVASDIDSNMDFGAGSNPVSVAVADFNADGKPDIAVLNATAGTVSILTNGATASNGISAASFTKKDFAVGDNPSTLIAADFNEDGKPDLAIAYQTNAWVTVLQNTTTTADVLFASGKNYACSSGSLALAAADLNNDGRRELIVANFNANTVSIIRNNVSTSGSTSFAAKVDIPTGPNPASIAIGDINGDGKDDIVTGNFADNTVSLLRCRVTTGGTFTLSGFQDKVDLAVPGQPAHIFLKQIDSDARPDLIIGSYVASSNTHNILIRRNAMTTVGIFTESSFSPAITIAAGSQPVAIGMGDIDGDGTADIAAANYNNKTVSVYRNISTGTSISTSTITAKVDFSAGNTPLALAIADLDLDGKPDMVTANDIDNTISVLHNYNATQVPAGFPESSASVSLGSFVNVDITDSEWGQEAPPGYTIAGVSNDVVSGTTANAGRFVYFASQGNITPMVPVKGALTFSAKGSGTIEVQLITTWNAGINQRKTFALTSSYQDFGWNLSLYPQQEYILAVIVNGGNSSPNASATFKKNICLNLQQAGMTGNFTRFRADAGSLIGNKETDWAGYSDQFSASRKKYLQHSAFSRMRFQTDASQIAIEYVRDSYDKTVRNLYPFSQTYYNKDFKANGDTTKGWHGINLATKVTPGKTYTISRLYTTNPKYVWYNASMQPISGVLSLAHGSGNGPDTVYSVTAPAEAANLGLLVQRTTDTVNFNNPVNDTYLVNANAMIEEGAYGASVPGIGTVPTAYTPYTGTIGSRISGPAVFIDGKLYNYYQVEGNDVAKNVQYVSDVLPPGTKTVEVMMPGQGTYSVNGVLADPHTRRSGNYLRAVYLPNAATTQSPGTTVAPGSVLFIHDSILSGFNISSDAQNNVWMMKIMRDSTYGFTGDVFSEGYAGRILHTDTYNAAALEAFAQKLAAYNVDNFWFQLGVNDYANYISLPAFYNELNTLVERLKVLRPNAVIYIQSIGPVNYDGPNAETYADDERATTGPTGNDFRDIQRAIATAPSHSYCRFVDFADLFPATIDNLADGIHPTDKGNELYAGGIRQRSTLLGNILPAPSLAMNRATLRQFVRNVENVAAVTAKGGGAPYTFAIVFGSGTLPAGLTFLQNGIFKGTATEDGSFPIRVMVTDAYGATAYADYTLIVKPVPTVIAAPAIIAGGKVGAAYSVKFRGARGYGKYTLSRSGTLPPGLTYNASTRTLSGTPTTSGNYTFSMNVTDHWGFTGGSTYNFNVGSTGSTVPVPTDAVVASAEVNSAGELIIKATVHDIYTQRIYLYYDLYIQQNGGNNYMGSKQIVIETGELQGTINFGRLNVGVNASFTLTMSGYTPAPASSDGKNFTYIANTSIPLTGNANTGAANDAFTLIPVPYVSGGHLFINGSVQHTHSQNIYIYLEMFLNGTSILWKSKTVIINAGQLTGTPVDCGLLPVSGNFTLRVANYGLSPSQSDGYTFTYLSQSNFNLTN